MPDEGRDGMFTQIPVSPIELVRVGVPEQFKKLFSFKGPVHLWCMVTKISSRDQEQQRVLMVTPSFVFLCEPEGRISRVLRLWEIEKIYIQNYRPPKGSESTKRVILIKSKPELQEPSLVLYLDTHPHNKLVTGMPPGQDREGNPQAWDTDPLVPVRVINQARKERVGTDLPVHIIKDQSLNVRSRPGTFGPFDKSAHYLNPRKKMEKWSTEPPPPRPPPPEPEPVYEREATPEPEPEPVYEPAEEEVREVQPVHHQPEPQIEYCPPRPPPPPPAPPQPMPPPPPPEEMMLVPSDMLQVLAAPQPVVYRRRKHRAVCGAPSRGPRDRLDEVHLHLYMHRPQPLPPASAPLAFDDELPAVRPVALTPAAVPVR